VANLFYLIEINLFFKLQKEKFHNENAKNRGLDGIRTSDLTIGKPARQVIELSRHTLCQCGELH
jgi:hypothetical protein